MSRSADPAPGVAVTNIRSKDLGPFGVAGQAEVQSIALFASWNTMYANSIRASIIPLPAHVVRLVEVVFGDALLRVVQCYIVVGPPGVPGVMIEVEDGVAAVHANIVI